VKKYIDASTASAILLLALPIVAVKTIYVFSLLGSKLEKRAFQVNGFGVLIQLVLAIFFVARYDLSGAAAMMLVGEFFAMLMAYFFCRNELGSQNIIDSVVLRIFLISASLALIVFFGDINLVWSLVLGAPLYLIMALLFGIVPESFLEKLKIKKSTAV